MTMDKRSLYDGLNKLELELENSLQQLGEMKLALQEIVEKNTTLELENQKLRDHVRELNQVAEAPAEKIKQELSKSRMNLEKSMKKAFMFVMIFTVLVGSMMNPVPFVWKLSIEKAENKKSGGLMSEDDQSFFQRGVVYEKTAEF